MFGSALLRREGVRGFGFGIGCLGVIQMTRDGHRQVGIGRIGVDTVTVMTPGEAHDVPFGCNLPADFSPTNSTSLAVLARVFHIHFRFSPLLGDSSPSSHLLSPLVDPAMSSTIFEDEAVFDTLICASASLGSW